MRALLCTGGWCGVYASSDALVAAITDYAAGKELDEKSDRFGPSLRDSVTYIGRDLSDPDEVRDWLWAFLEYDDPRSIAGLSRYASRNWEVSGPATAVVWTRLLASVRSDITEYTEIVENGKSLQAFYDATGYPDFPLQVNKEFILEELRKVPKAAILEVWRDAVDWKATTLSSNLAVDYEGLAAAFSNAKTVRQFIGLLSGSDEYIDEWDAAMLLNDSANAADVTSLERTLIRANTLLSELTANDLLALPRGEGEMGTCDFLADDVLHLYHIAEKTLGWERTQNAVIRYAKITGFDDDSIRDYVCKVAASKNQRDLADLVDESVAGSISQLSELAALLVEPQRITGWITDVVKFMQVAKKIGFPEFPLRMNDGEAREIARILIYRFGHPNAMDYTVEDLKSEYQHKRYHIISIIIITISLSSTL
jgi:hypothetical protein